MSHSSLHKSLLGLAAASAMMGVNSSYYDFDSWSEPHYISHGRWYKSRTEQWIGHSKKTLSTRRKRNKAAKQARKLQRR